MIKTRRNESPDTHLNGEMRFSSPTSLLGENSLIAQRYRVGVPLGSGAFATVYSAYDLVLHRTISVKVTTGSEGLSPAAGEATLQGRCQHPNVMPLYDTGHDALLNLSYLVMPLYPGSDLAELLSQRGPLPFRKTLHCLDQLCEALDFLWSRSGMVHGDLKPANLWITQGGTALLMDFNLSALFTHSDVSPLGTPGYTAPEVFSGKRDRASDVFSLGCVLYECLTGQPPFRNDLEALSGRYLPVRQLRPEIYPELERVICTALEVQPERRYQTAREFQSALRAPFRHLSFGKHLVRETAHLFGKSIVLLGRSLWHKGFFLGRRLVRRPLRTLQEGVVLFVLALICRSLLYGWVLHHPLEIALLKAGLGLIAFVTVVGFVKKQRRLWHAQGGRSTLSSKGEKQ